MLIPPHPGESLDELYFNPLNLDVYNKNTQLKMVELCINIASRGY